MPILDRESLQQSPLADLHAIASELSIDGYRRLRKPELITAILERQGGEGGPGGEAGEPARGEAEEPAGREAEKPAGREAEQPGGREAEQPADRSRGRGRRRRRAEPETQAVAAEEVEQQAEAEAEPAPQRDELVEGVVELLPNGSGFLRVNPPEPSDDDVYISAAQVKRCDLVSGDRISGPRRAPRRSERFASLVRIDTINDRPADEVADSARFDELPVGFPSDRFRLGSDDPTLKAIEWLTPFGKGSRVVIAGRAQAGKTEALRRLAVALGAQDELKVLVALIGARPEELPEWAPEPAAAVSLAG